MSYIFMDESGDLGFNFNKKKTSRYFVVTFVFSTDNNIIDKLVKNIFKGFSKTEVKNHNGVLHAYKENPKTKQKLLNAFHEKKAGNILVVYLNKKKVYTKLQNEKHVLYNYVTNILLDRLCTKKLIPTNEKIKIIVSRRETNRFLNDNFKSYLKNQTKNNHKLDIEIDIVSSSAEKGLQVVDMVSWAIFKKYEHGDDSYYNLFKQEIVEENPLFS